MFGKQIILKKAEKQFQKITNSLPPGQFNQVNTLASSLHIEVSTNGL